jgi:hypothetical protein
MAQLMMLGISPFIQLWEEDEILSHIIQNHCEVHKETPNFESISTCPLQKIFPSSSAPKYSVATTILHKLLPHELKMPRISQKTMIELVTQVQVIEGKHLNINKKLNQEQQLSITNLLKQHQHTFAWAYSDMK